MVEKTKISEESAQEQFDKLLDYYFLSFDDIVKADGKEAAQTIQNLFIRAIMKGIISIESEDGLKVIQKLINKIEGVESVTYDGDKVAKARIAMGKITGKGDDEMRQNTFMGCLSGFDAKQFIGFKGGDLTIYTRLAAVFSLV